MQAVRNSRKIVVTEKAFNECLQLLLLKPKGETKMRRHARAAFNELKKLGVHVLDEDMGWPGYFAISAELYGDGSAGDEDILKLDYYEDYLGEVTVIPAILKKHGLYFEWNNTAIACVFDG